MHWIQILTFLQQIAVTAECQYLNRIFFDVEYQTKLQPQSILMSLKVIHFQSIFLINFYLKRLIYVQKYGITHQTAIQQGIQEKEEFLQ